MSTIILIAVFLVSYLIGAIPWGYLIGKRHGLDIRKLGSKNVGATNVTRVVGKWSGRLCFLLDFLKGFIPVLVVTMLFDKETLFIAQIIAALSTVIGHMFPVYLWFRGGKGISTAGGAILALAPYSFGVAGIVWIVVYLLSRYVSLASIAAATVLPICANSIYLFKPDLYPHSPWIIGFLYFISALAILKHSGNIKRLLNGTENRFEKKG